jgi:glucose/arabinose dehydrogenase
MLIRGKLFVLLMLAVAAGTWADSAIADTAIQDAQEGLKPELPAPYATKSARNFPDVNGWSAGKTPLAPKGFRVEEFASLKQPRWIYVLPSGDVLVAQASTDRRQSPNAITLLKDADGDGKAEKQTVLKRGLNLPFGMALVGDTFYYAVTDGVYAVPFDEFVRGAGEARKIAELLAGGYNNHWTRNILPSRDGKKLLVSVGSGSNVGENGMQHEEHRANILEMNLDGSDVRVFGAGLRNPVGMDWEPVTGQLWTAVNERDGLGDDLVPDYITSVKEGGFYGWPYSYFGQHEDPRLAGQKPELVKSAIKPDVALGSHTASLGLAFYDGKNFPAKYQGGAFVGQHGSWNRSAPSGYKVVFVPFKDGKPTGEVEDFLTGFMEDAEENEVYGRPVGVAVAADGSLLVADDGGGKIWRVEVDGDTADGEKK